MNVSLTVAPFVGRVHALLVDFCRETTPIPDPHEDQDAFWQFLA